MLVSTRWQHLSVLCHNFVNQTAWSSELVGKISRIYYFESEKPDRKLIRCAALCKAVLSEAPYFSMPHFCSLCLLTIDGWIPSWDHITTGCFVVASICLANPECLWNEILGSGTHIDFIRSLHKLALLLKSFSEPLMLRVLGSTDVMTTSCDPDSRQRRAKSRMLLHTFL